MIAFNDNGLGGGTATFRQLRLNQYIQLRREPALTGSTTSPGYSLWLEYHSLAPFITTPVPSTFVFT